jgi:tetratricopeptide (TPR) repeat protein
LIRPRLAAAALALAIVTTMSPGLRAQQTPPAAPAAAEPALSIGGARADIGPRDFWAQATASAREGDLDAATKHASDLNSNKEKAYGIKTFPTYAMSAAALARETERTQPETAAWADKLADSLDPKSPAVAFSKADRAAARNDWAKAIPLAFTGLARVITNYRSQVLSRADLMVVAALAIIVAAVIFAIALLFRYGRSMSHDFREMLSTRLRGGSVSVLAFALLFAPIFLWLGPMWLVFYWFVIFFAYANLTEKIIIVVLALLVALVPIGLDAASHWAAGVDSPVVLAALASSQQSYQPEALRRLQEVLNVSPDNPMLQVLVGNLLTFEGNDEQAASHYRRAIELQKSHAGAHVNLGNLHYFNNEYQAAITEYEEAAKYDPSLAIAFYNHSVAAGETYKFDQQASMLQKARDANRSLVEKLTRNAPIQKVVMYHPPIRQAWQVSGVVAKGIQQKDLSIFGNYSFFDPQTSLLNPVSLGALGSILLAILLWMKRRRSGFAGACIKCGRTFCPRCKSARESATYCTQCIHIYLKRDGVSLDTKRHKLEEVSEYHTGMTRRNRIFATFLPGSAQMLEGRTLAGLIGILLFAACVATAVFTGRLAPALGPSAEVAQLVVRAIAIVIAVVLWLMLSLPVYKRRTTA